MTPFIKKKEIKKDWYVIDAENAIVGRLAAYISKVLRGKNKSSFNPHIDNGDFVIVTTPTVNTFTVTAASSGTNSGNVTVTLSGAGKYVCQSWTKTIPYNNRATLNCTFREVFEP